MSSFVADKIVMDGLTFDDVLLIPAYSEVLPKEVTLKTRFSQEGIIIRIAAESIRVCSRPSKGVTVMKVNGDDKVVTIARAPHEAEEENSETENETEENAQDNSVEQETTSEENKENE